MKRIRKLTTAFLVIALLVTSLMAVPVLADDAPVLPDAPEIVRLAGDSRYLTAVEVSKGAYPDEDLESEAVVIASGENFPDALAGSVLAHEVGGPVLLTRKDSIDKKVLDEIDRLEPAKIYILGGEKAVGAAVEATLAKKGIAIERIEGVNRYETAALIAEEVIGEGTEVEVFLATGENYADALAIGPYAAYNGIPILLTKSDELHADTAKALKALKVKSVTILGGEKAVSKAVVRSIEELGISNIERIEGKNRELTALAIAETEAFGFSSDKLIVVTGDNFADAVVGAYFGAILEDSSPVPILLVRDGVKEEVDEYIREAKLDKLYIIGGPKAVSEAVEAELELALLDLPPEVTATGNEFFFEAAAADAKFTYTYLYDAETKVVKLNGKTLKLGLDEFFSWDGYELTFKDTHLNTLAVGEYVVAVTIDGHAMKDQKIIVKDPKVATLDVTVDPEELTEGKDKEVELTFTGYDPKAAEGQEGAITFTGAVVRVNGAVLNSLLYTADDDTKTVTLLAGYVKELAAGEYTVKVKLADGREAEGVFEVKAVDAFVTFATNGTELDEAKRSIEETQELEIAFVGITPVDAAKVAISFAGEKLTLNREYTFTDSKLTLKAAYLEDFAVGEYAIAVSYDGAALNALTLNIIAGDLNTAKSKVTIAEKVKVTEIVPVTISLVDAGGNPVKADEVVVVVYEGTATVKLSKSSDMAGATASPLNVRLDAAGKATVYLQASTLGAGLKLEVLGVTAEFEVIAAD